MRSASLVHKPSSHLIRILETKTITDVIQEYQIVKISLQNNAISKTFTLLQFLDVMMKEDTSEATRKVIENLPLGDASITAILGLNKSVSLERRYLSQIYLTFLSSVNQIVNQSADSYYKKTLKMTISEAQKLFGGNLTGYENLRERFTEAAINKDQNAMRVMQHAMQKTLTAELQQRVKELGNKSADSDEVAIKGLIAVGTYVPINIISQVYKINIDLLDSLTMYGLANHISNVSQERFVQIFNISSESIQLLDKARMRDIRVLVALENLLPSMEIDDISPVSLSNVVLKTNNGRLLDTMTVISNARKTSVENMTLSDVKDYGQGTDADVMKLFTVVKVEPSYFNAISQIRLAVVRQIWNTSVHGIGGFNMIDLARALCRKGHRYNGKKCVPFDGCKASGLCSKNASCTNIIGSYLCQCKTGFSKNSIGSCEALPLPSQAQLLGERC